MKRRNVSNAQAAQIATKLIDKTYGESVRADVCVSVSISLPTGILHQLEDEAMANKRCGIGPKNVSAIIREALGIRERAQKAG